MGNSLLEQLKKAGLVDAQTAKQAQQEKRKQAKTQKGKKVPGADAARQQLQQQAHAEKAARDRELERQRALVAEKKAVAAQIRQLVAAHRVAVPDGEIPFNFTDGTKVRRLFVTEALRNDLSRGRLAIVRVDQRYELVAAAVVEKIAQRDPGCVVLCNTAQQPTNEPDDPYAAFQVPDDLMW